MIERTNFLDLLGADTRKYHSCIITSYSFDILYFEHIVLPRLRKAGIINVNLFVDAGMLQKQFENYKGKEYIRTNRDYSITPVNMAGAFHSKIMLAVGKNKGLLAIGSGNITASGLSNNEEIWASCYYKEGEVLTNNIFGQTIHYLNNLGSYAYGANSKKLSWIKDNSTWYKNLLEIVPKQTPLIFKGNKIELFTSNGDFSFFQEVIRVLPPNPKAIKILSPFYNTSGGFIKNLFEALSPGKIHCIIDPDNGNFPNKLPSHPSIEFSKWSDLNTSEGKLKRSLHAKAIQVEYIDKTFFLFGSSNATTEAFGSLGSLGKNAETLIRIQSEKKFDFFKDLGINFPAVGKLDLSTLSPNKVEYEIIPITYEFEISHAEANNLNLQLHLKTSTFLKANLKIENADSQMVFEKMLEGNDKVIEIFMNDVLTEEAFKCSLWKEGKRVSNYALIQNATQLLKNNPDERLARWNEIRNHDIFEGLGIEVFLDFLHKEKLFAHSSTLPKHKIKQFDEEENPDRVSTEVFNKNSAIENLNSSAQYHLTSLIEDFLSQLVFGKNQNEEISDNTEETALDNLEQGMSNGIVVHREGGLSFTEGLRIIRKVETVLSRIDDFYLKSTTNFHSGREKLFSEKEKLSMEHLNALIIGLSLILKYLNKTFTQSSYELKLGYKEIKKLKETEDRISLIRHKRQLGNPDGVVSYDIDSSMTEKIIELLKNEKTLNILELNTDVVKEITHYYFEPVWFKDYSSSFIFYTLGSFLYAYQQNLINSKKDDQDLYQRQLEKLTDLSIILLLSYKWKKSDLILRELLYLNIFYIFKISKSESKMSLHLKTLIANLNTEANIEEKDMTEFLKLYGEYLKFYNKLQNDPSSLSEPLSPMKAGELIYSTSFGFCILTNIKTNKHIDLISPLGRHCEQKNLYGFSDIYIGNNIKVFNNVSSYVK